MLTAKKKFFLLLLAGATLITALKLGVFNGFTLEMVREHIDNIKSVYSDSPVMSVLLFMFSIVFVTSLSIPLGNIICIAGGAVFGTWQSVLFSAFASASGATCALLLSRYFFKDEIHRKYGHRISKLHEQIKENGFAYIVALRFAYVAPYPLVNWSFGISDIKLRTFFLGTMLGQMPVKTLFAYAGSNLTKYNTFSEIIDYKAIIGFALIAVTGIWYTTHKSRKSIKSQRQGKKDAQAAGTHR